MTHQRLFVECKHYTRGWAFQPIWKLADKQAKKEKKLPVLALGQKSLNGWFYVVHSDDAEAFCREYLETKAKVGQDDGDSDSGTDGQGGSGIRCGGQPEGRHEDA